MLHFIVSGTKLVYNFLPKTFAVSQKKPPQNEGAFLLVPKHQSVAELVDDNRFLPIHLVGENLT